MKSLLTIAIATFAAISISAATWTFHACKDNYAFVDIGGGSAVGQPSTSECFIEWDYGDAGYDGGVFFAFGPLWNWEIISLGFNETQTVTLDDISTWGSVSVNGPTPDFNGGGSPVILYVGGGEFWIDFAPNGTVRINISEPSDFGKWAWDGSINPNWVEPLSVVEHGKHLAKGHAK